MWLEPGRAGRDGAGDPRGFPPHDEDPLCQPGADAPRRRAPSFRPLSPRAPLEAGPLKVFFLLFVCFQIRKMFKLEALNLGIGGGLRPLRRPHLPPHPGSPRVPGRTRAPLRRPPVPAARGPGLVTAASPEPRPTAPA